MNKNITIIFIFTLLLFSCNSQNSGKIYTCSMHPQIRETKPGNCPICGMVLIELVESTNDSINIEVSDLVKPAYQFILSSVKTVKPFEKEISNTISANGIITYDTKRLYSISSRFAGRIEKLYVKYIFQEVYKGQKIFEIYSPEINTEQQNLIYLLKNDSTSNNLINNSKEKLKLLGLTENQVNEIIKNKKILETITVYSEYSGYIIDNESPVEMNTSENSNSMSSQTKSVVSSEFPLKEGSYIEKGQTLFNIVNNDVVWAVVKIYQSDFSMIKKNQKAEIFNLESDSVSFSGNVNFIETINENNNKALNVRVFVTNSDNKFKIGQVIKCLIYTDNISGTWIPKTSVLDLGINKIVFVKKGKLFEATSIKTGIYTDNYIQLISGISDTTEIAINAEYLTDSESFIKVTN